MIENRKIWIWSDLHLGHRNIINYANRPFDNVDNMNRYITEAWRKTVGSDDIIINLGDVSLGMNKETLPRVITNLPGHKILIMGNHDRKKSPDWWRDVGFEEVSKYPIIFEQFFILSHEPVFVNSHSHYVNIHGHTHEESSDNKLKINVSVEQTGYRPLLFHDIRDSFEEKV